MTSIFFVSLMNGAPWGGSEELWYRTALYAAGNGYRVACALYDWKEKEERIRILERAGVRVYRLPNKRKKPQGFLARLVHKPLTRLRLAHAIRSLPLEQYDRTVISQGGFEVYTPTWRHFHQRLNRFALLFHNYNEAEVFSPTKAESLRVWMQKATINLFAADRIRQVLEEKLQVPVPNSAVLINPISFAPPQDALPYPGLQPGPVRLVMLAALDTGRKAQDSLIGALALPPWTSRNWELHLYGSGKDEAMLREWIGQKGLQDKIFLKGHTDDPRTVLEAAHLVLQLTRIDAMPLAVVEALACARPVAVTRVGDMPLWVRPGVNGWVGEAATVTAISEVLEQAWAGRQHWATYGRRSYDVFREKFPSSPEHYFLQQLGGSE